jgi:ATP-dependent DNA ligase
MPQLAKAADEVPAGDGWLYEPKLDGFRTIVFVDGDSHQLQSRNGKPLDRYFPELRFPPGSYVIDGELIIPGADGEADFEALQERIHPAASRVEMLAEARPAAFVAFDLLAQDGRSLLDRPFSERRTMLAAAVKHPVRLIDQTADVADTAKWLQHGEGVIAKRAADPYLPGERKGMIKIKRRRTIDCVAIGWRMAASGDRVGSIMIGLYQEDGTLRGVGHCSGFTAKRAKELLDIVRPLETGERGDGAPNRWSASRDTSFARLRPELVLEVSYDHASGGNIRHGARLLRFRDDKDPSECLFEQLT